MQEVTCEILGRRFDLSYKKTFAKDYVLYKLSLGNHSIQNVMLFQYLDNRGIEFVPVDLPDYLRKGIIDVLKKNGEVL